MKKLLLLVVFILSFIFWNNSAFCQTKNPLLDDGIKQYQEENYEEAIEVLEKLQTKGPQSSLAAYFLGMAYKQTQDYVKAAANLEVALTLPPAVKEALVEQVNILFQLDRLAEAKKWIAVAKKENIAPANISFLEGMILARERKYSAAIDSFERAKTLDKNLVPTADYQIGLCFLNDKKFKSARERFKATASYDPQSDLATYARQYMDAVENTLFYTRPLRVTLGISGGYDSNVTSKPRHESVAGGAGNPETGVFSPSVRLEFVPQLESNWLFNAMFYSTANFNQNYVHSRDSVSSTFPSSPAIISAAFPSACWAAIPTTFCARTRIPRRTAMPTLNITRIILPSARYSRCC